MPLSENPHNKETLSSNYDNEELITREDGSQVVKVRKRKRRSKQLAKKPKTSPGIKWAIFSLFIIFILLPAVGALIVTAKYNGGKFKATTEENIRSITSADTAEISSLKVTPISASAKRATINWHSDQFLSRSTFSKLSAQLNPASFIENSWHGEEVLAGSGSIYFQTPKASDSDRSSPAQAESLYDFESLRCENLAIHFGENKNAPSIEKLNASIRNRNKGSYKVFFRNGELNMPNWPLLPISSGVFSSNNGKIEIESTIDSKINSGNIEIKGSISTDTNQLVDMNLKASDYPIQELFTDAVAKIIKGEIESDQGVLSYDYSKSPGEAFRVTLPFNSLEITMGGFPMFQYLHEYTADTKYRDPIFNYCEGTLIKSLNETKLENIKFISNNLITVEGNININLDGKIRGILSLTLPQKIFKKPPPASFRGPVDGYYTCAVTLGGNIHSPHDNLQELILSRSAQRPEETKPTPSPLEEFDALTR